MKTFSLLFIVIACAARVAFAQAENGDRPPTPAEQTGVVGSGRPTQPLLAPNLPDGFTVMNGFVYAIRAGVMTPLQTELVVRVSPNGTITGFDGRTHPIPQGRVLTLFATATPMTVAAGATPEASGTNASPGGLPAGIAGTAGAGAATGGAVGGTGFNAGTSMRGDFPFFVIPQAVAGIPAFVNPATGLKPAAGTNRNPAAAVNPRNPATGTNGTNVPNPANPATQPASPTATGNQQNTTGTQQIPPGQGTSPATVNPAGTGTGGAKAGGNTAPANAGGIRGGAGAPGATGGGAPTGGVRK